MNGHEDRWIADNQIYMAAAIAEVRAALERQARRQEEGESGPEARAAPGAETTRRISAGMSPPAALDQVTAVFGLSTFERGVLLLCAGAELDGSFAALCAAANGDPARPYPTFGLALAALDGAHWSALTPAAPLRRWRLIDLAQAASVSLTSGQLRIDERILHCLTGIHYLDERLQGLITLVPPDLPLVPSQEAQAQRIARTWEQAGAALMVPLAQLCGPDEPSKRAIAATACARLGLDLFALDADCIPTQPAELDGLVRLWEREALLTPCALYVDAHGIDPAEGRTVLAVSRLLERVHGGLILATRDRWRAHQRPALTLDVTKPTAQEQRTVWRAALGSRAGALNGRVEELVAQFNLGLPAIQASVEETKGAALEDTPLATALWDAGRAQARPKMDDLAQRLEPVATWADLVLPEAERGVLREIAGHVRRRALVYEAWGFAATSSRGLGISALFAGASGTGKTMAAEVLANELRLDLYRIDLSSVVSKYIGETEKNLRRLFDTAEDGGAILFFDEADALFGKRSEVKDSHDRYANIEINYLLQRMEQYRGLAVLATNMKGALDPAFLRRLRFVVNFPLPDAAQRAEIWRRVFPPATPTEDVELGKLARLNVTGGNIRNIALNAAFLAAGEGGPVRMTHILRATRAEYAKIEKPLSDAEIGGW